MNICKKYLAISILTIICLMCGIAIKKYDQNRDNLLTRIDIESTRFKVSVTDKIEDEFKQHQKTFNNGRIFVINLDKNKERLTRFDEQFKAQNIEYNRFEAVLGYDVEITDQNGNLHTGMDFRTKNFRFKKGQKYHIKCRDTSFYHYVPLNKKGIQTAGEVGVYCSHYEILNKIVENNYKYGVIFEDDAVISNNFKSYLDTVLKNIDELPDIDIIYLAIGMSYGKKWYSFAEIPNEIKQYKTFDALPDDGKEKYFTKINDSLSKFIYKDEYKRNKKSQMGHGAGYAYIITNKGARKLLRSMEVTLFPFDHNISNIKNNNEVNIYVTNQLKVGVDTGHSTYTGNGKQVILGY